jgi:hypothetical protein
MGTDRRVKSVTGEEDIQRVAHPEMINCIIKVFLLYCTASYYHLIATKMGQEM